MTGQRFGKPQIILNDRDGKWLGSLASGMLWNGNELTDAVKKYRFVSKHRADDFTTDSAAGATGVCTGHKTIIDYRMLPSWKNFAWEPSTSLRWLCFKCWINLPPTNFPRSKRQQLFCHVSERDDVKSIMEFLPKRQTLDFSCGGGKSRASNRSSKTDLSQELTGMIFMVDNWSGIPIPTRLLKWLVAAEESL